jgi:hypothetical protein
VLCDAFEDGVPGFFEAVDGVVDAAGDVCDCFGDGVVSLCGFVCVLLVEYTVDVEVVEVAEEVFDPLVEFVDSDAVDAYWFGVDIFCLVFVTFFWVFLVGFYFAGWVDVFSVAVSVL